MSGARRGTPSRRERIVSEPTALRTGDLPAWAGLPTLGARLILGATFISMGISKILEPIKFLKAVKQYEILPLEPPILINSTAVILPWLEVVIGLLLIAGIARRGGATISFGMLVVFNIAILKLGLDHQAKNPEMAFTEIVLDCGCGAGPVNVAWKLLQNLGLIILSAGLMVSKSHRFSFASGGAKDCGPKG